MRKYTPPPEKVTKAGEMITPEQKTASERRVPPNQDRPLLEKLTVSDRGLKDYLRLLEVSPEYLRGKKILDVGSGKTERFSKEAKEWGADVYSVNPEHRGRSQREKVKKRFLFFRDPRWQKKSVAAVAQELPFKDNSFDMVTSLSSVPFYIISEEGKRAAIREMTRVVKQGGEIFIAPVPLGVLREVRNLTQSEQKEILYKREFGESAYEYLLKEGYELEINLELDQKEKPATIIIRKPKNEG